MYQEKGNKERSAGINLFGIVIGIKGLMLFAILFSVFVVGVVNANDSPARPEKRDVLLDAPRFIHIPGPNPILVRGSNGEWDNGVLETAGVFKDLGTYYLYYHATGGGSGYQVGVATSSHPLGPFKRYEKNPILKVGPQGGHEDIHVACAIILKEGINEYYMWYCAMSKRKNVNTKPYQGIWDVCLATASHPLGPWTKYEGNPVISDFGYVSAVVNVDGKYYLYSAYPIGSIGPDYSPMSLAIADSPEGPWQQYPQNPILVKGNWGEWDDGGYSDAAVIYSAGVFHMFAAGAKLYSPRLLTRESIGYAYSFDGIHFAKYGLNPIVPREADPQIAAMSEPRVLWEPPFIYIYSTLRYTGPWRSGDETRFPRIEDLGVQVLVTQRPFSIDMPIINVTSLAAKMITSLIDCPPISLGNVSRVALTVECKYSERAKRGVRVHIRPSYDGVQTSNANTYDTADLNSLENEFKPGQLCRKTFELNTSVRFIKAIVENLDESESVSDLKLTVTLGG